MNFEFLKDLRGIGHIYKNCDNAEKLVMTMPELSVVASRMSAETLAKFIYLAAHSEEEQSMTFADILCDPVFRKFINNRNIMNAFHSIRKSGNRAVHGNEDETTEEAIDVLDDLHYAVGESARILGLIEDYPAFDSKIDAYPEARLADVRNIEAEAQKMFLEYVEKYNAQAERDHYYQNNIDNLLHEFAYIASDIILVPGNVDLNEVLEFKSKPQHASSLKPIQAYFGFLGVRALRKLRGELYRELEGRDLEFSGVLTIYGEEGYTTSDLVEFVYGIMHDLPSAEGFRIATKYYGPSVSPWFEANEKERKKEFSSEIAEIGKTEDLTYSIHEFLYNHGEGWTGKFENGEWVRLKERYTSDILDKDFGSDWWCWNLDLYVEFDFDKYPAIVEALHNCVRKHIPEDQLRYCEDSWNDGEVGHLCESIDWYPRKLRVVQDFLDELNQIIKPIMGECTGGVIGSEWYINDPPFAIAAWDWTDEGFKITGTEL